MNKIKLDIFKIIFLSVLYGALLDKAFDYLKYSNFGTTASILIFLLLILLITALIFLLIKLYARLQKRIKGQQGFYEIILDNLPIEIIIYDKNLRYVYINKQAITDDVLRTWLIGKTDFDYCNYRHKSSELAERRLEYFKKAIAEKNMVSFLDILPDKTNPDKLKYIFRSNFPYYVDNELLYMYGFSTYITDVLEKNKIKDDYIKTLEGFAFHNSHKIRRPVSNIIGLINLMDTNYSPQDFEKIKEHLLTCAKELDSFTKETNEYINKSQNQINNLN